VVFLAQGVKGGRGVLGCFEMGLNGGVRERRKLPHKFQKKKGGREGEKESLTLKRGGGNLEE